MATVTHAVATNVDTGNTPNSSSAFTPVAGDLLVVITGTSTSTSTALDGALTASANGITFSALTTALYDSSTDKLCAFVANQLVPASPVSMTVTWTPSDAGQQSIHSVFRIAGMTRTGLDAVRQFVANPNQTSGTAPSLTFASAVLTGNPTILAIAVADSTPAFTAPAAWGGTETSDAGGASPNGGLWDGFRNSGFTGTTVTWSTNAGGGYAELGIEFDTTLAPVTPGVIARSFTIPTPTVVVTVTPAPELVDFFEDDSASGVTTLSSGSISVQSGDLLAVKGVVTSGGTINTPTASGLTFTLQADHAPADGEPRAYIWTAPCPSTTSVTVTATTSANQKAFIVEQWRGVTVDATPAVVEATMSIGTPGDAIVTEADDSIITWVVTDFNEQAAVTPNYSGSAGISDFEFAEQYSGAWSWWATETYDTGAAGSKLLSWTVPDFLDGAVVGLELQLAAGGDAIAEPGVIACAVAMTRPSVNAAAGPALIARSFAMTRALVNVAAGPAAVAAVVSLVRAADNITAGPAAISTVAALSPAAAGAPTIVTPATIVCSVAMTRPGVNVAAGPSAVAAAVAVARAADNVTAGPQTVAASVTVVRPAVGTAPTPATIATLTSLVRPGVNVAAGPLTLAALVALTRAAVNVAAVPAAVPVEADLPPASALAGGNITTHPDAIVVTVAMTQATPHGDATAQPAATPVGVTIPDGSRAVTASPAVTVIVATLPTALAFEGAPVVVASGVARVGSSAVGVATTGGRSAGAATLAPAASGSTATTTTARGQAEVSHQ